MSESILVRGARQLLTLRGPNTVRRGLASHDLGIIRDGAMLIRDGRVVSVGASHRIENMQEAKTATVLDAHGCVVMPGFVDAHTHLLGGGAKEENSFPPNGGGLTRKQPNRAYSLRSLSSSRLEFDARRSLASFLRHGTTTLEAKAGSAEEAGQEHKTLRILETIASNCPARIRSTWYLPKSLPREFQHQPTSFLRHLHNEVLGKIHRQGRAKAIDMDPSAWNVDAPSLLQFLRTCRQHGLQIRLHCGLQGDAAGELKMSAGQTTAGQAELFSAAELAEQGAGHLLDLALHAGADSVSHLVHITLPQMQRLALSNTIGVVLPSHAFLQGRGEFAPARQMLDLGAALAIGTGYDPLLHPSCTMMTAITMACTKLKMTAAEAITASTIHGAHALGISEITGSLQPGKAADFLVLRMDDYREIPNSLGVNLISKVFAGGKMVYQESELDWAEGMSPTLVA